MLNSGIYKISFTDSENFYIGSTINFETRRKSHFNELKRFNHNNEILQRAWNKYGESNFRFEILSRCPPEYRIKLEQWFLNTMKPEYNISKNAICNTNCKLENQEVTELLNLYIYTDITRNELANKYGISRRVIDEIVCRNTYLHVKLDKQLEDSLKMLKNIRKSSRKDCKLNDLQVSEIKWLLNNNYSPYYISMFYNVKRGVIRNIEKGCSYKTIKALNDFIPDDSIKLKGFIDQHKRKLKIGKPFIAILTDGTIKKYLCIKDCEYSRSSVYRVLTNQTKDYKGIIFQYI